ncbi:hypothetical protein NEF87_000648 [Candidatus Lokiarchaeum ossiferum]|uniref:Serine dehydratase-like alpha subunit domain-containing protein n=1 Tax=Candidatus Lokiarchaeum ossiferum TaxID=2951803 RepID=A0ABY6HLH5_9ARCH|nr:hypothetical protein NEF87_000648 [Candidatus Lokiarchaeum sp. B-35]
MTKRSIFNDVIGPLTRGPSSSHTGASYFIGTISRYLIGDEIDSVEIFFDENGSFGKVYKYQNSEFGFIAGLLNISMDSHEFLEVKRIARSKNIAVHFQTKRLPEANHPNYMELKLSSRHGEKIELTARSTGGGTIAIDSVNGWKTSIDGQTYDLLIRFPTEQEAEIRNYLDIQSKKLGMNIMNFQKQKKSEIQQNAQFLQVKLDYKTPITWITHLTSLPNVKIWTSEPTFKVMKGSQIFNSAKKMREYAEAESLSLGEAALEYEMNLLQTSKENILKEMEKRVVIMLKSVEAGLESKIAGMKTLDSSASKLANQSNKNALFSNSHNTLAAIRAMATMEIASSGGYVCAAPTGGSSGVIPATLYTLYHDFNINLKDLVYCAFAAGGVGLIHAIRSTFAAEVAGCQVEIGIAGAMAAAAVVEAASGSVNNALDAAAICLQNTMGLVCDLVAGFCEIPCHTRNAVAASNAFVCCDLVLGGYSNHITLDDSIDASDSSGKMLPSELRCTALGGIAITPSAQRLFKKEPEDDI